jgi:ParB family transcriptional regulator, chromosome partitioning protein
MTVNEAKPMSEKKIPRSGLGRGLSALMADVAQSSSQTADAQRGVQSLPIEQVVPNPNQPRRDFMPEALAELAQSIRLKGVVQPLIVRPTASGNTFEIVAGERRWRASQAAGLHEVPVLIKDYSDEEVLEVAIIENVQRADLNAVEEAMAYRQLMDRFGHTQEKLATSLSRSRSHIANILRLLQLPEPVLAQLRSGQLTAGHARALVTAPDAIRLANDVIKRGLSVRETERLAKSSGTAPKAGHGKVGQRGAEKDADTKAIEADLSANLGMLVQISHNGPDQGGTLSVRYRTLDDLDLLCDVLSKISRDMRGK